MSERQKQDSEKFVFWAFCGVILMIAIAYFAARFSLN